MTPIRTPVRTPTLLLASTLALAACTPDAGAPDTGTPDTAPAAQDRDLTAAQTERLLRGGPEPLLGPVRQLDYWTHYRLMQETGLEAALGGEAQAVEALKAIAESNARILRGAEADLPKLTPAAFTGEGMMTGYIGLSAAAFTGFMAAASVMRDAKAVDALASKPLDSKGTKAAINADGQLEVSIEMPFDEKGLSGTTKVKIRADLCPDAQGRVRLEMDADSSMRMPAKPGTGGYLRSKFVEEAYYDDDAQLIPKDPRDAYSVDIQLGGYDGRHLDEKIVIRGGVVESEEVRSTSGFSIFRPEERQAANAVLANAVGFSMHGLSRAIINTGSGGRGWIESGRCVTLEPTSTPGKRSGVQPSTSFQVLAAPRARADGAPAGGTVKATLDGGASLQPAGTKVAADAQFDYVAPAQKDQRASIAFEARSRRGVGRASLAFDTSARQAYRIVGGQNDFKADTVVCPANGPFDIRSGVGIVMHLSGGSGNGTFTTTGNAAGVTWSGGGSYTVALDADGRSGMLRANGTSTIDTPKGRFSDSIEPVFRMTAVDEGCGEARSEG